MLIRKVYITSLLLTFLLPLNIILAQSKIGLVLDYKTKKPIEGVNVFIKGKGVGTNTNQKGEFSLKQFTGVSEKDTINFSFVGFVTKKFCLSDLKACGYIVLMSEDSKAINEVIITTNIILNSQIKYKQLASLKVGVYGFGFALVDNNIWVIGGDESITSNGVQDIAVRAGNLIMKPIFTWESYSNKLNTYNFQEDKWTISEHKFDKRAYHSMLFYNNKVYLFGGKTLSRDKRTQYLDDKIEVYDVLQSSILVDNNNPHQAVNFASFLYQDNIIVMGGSERLNNNGEKVCTKKVHMLNLKTGYWYELNDMPCAMEVKGVIVNDTIFLIGGYDTKPLDEIRTFNLTLGTWSNGGQLIYAVQRPALAYYKNIIYIFENGIFQTYNIKTKEVKLYSIDLFLNSPEFICTNNKLYIIGGSEADGANMRPSSDLFCIDLREFAHSKVYAIKTL